MDPQDKNQRFNELLGEAIRQRRNDELKRSLEDVARDSETGISKSSLSLMETGAQQIAAVQLFELSRILDFSINEIFFEIEKKIQAEQHNDIDRLI